MEINKIDTDGQGIKFVMVNNTGLLASAFLYLLHNDSHKRPFAFIEDVRVEKEHRGQGLGTELVKAMITEARARTTAWSSMTQGRVIMPNEPCGSRSCPPLVRNTCMAMFTLFPIIKSAQYPVPATNISTPMVVLFPMITLLGPGVPKIVNRL